MENRYIFIARLKQSKDIRELTVKTKTPHMEAPEIKKKNKTDTLLEEIPGKFSKQMKTASDYGVL